MSKVVDERVLQMEFDNHKFERNVSTTLSTLDKLKQSLNLTGAAKGLEEVSDASKRVDMTTLATGVEAARTKFSALEIVAITALANITNSAVNAGKRLVSSLTIDQITSGWTKYEQKTSSVQTIMNSTGKSIEEVSAYLDKLMWYSDETSYGFTDMTASLAQLTSAGGDIEKLIPMIEGIANATAFAGKGSAEFSRAIYNLNQSYSAGYLQYMDWKSLDLAGVSSKQLKQTLIDTAVELGKITEGQVTLTNFSETLKDKWADTEVMEQAFAKFADLTEAAYKAVESGEYDTASEAIEALSSQYDEVAVKAFKSAQEAKSFTEAIEATKDAVSSGWLRTSEIIFGDYEEAKELWTNLANTLWGVFASGADSRNELLTGALRNSGWDDLLNAGIMDEDSYSYYVKEVAKEHGIAIDEMIEKEGSLEKALQKGFESGEISSDVLSSALGRLSEKYQNCSEEELKNLGYTKEQVAALTELNDKIQNGSLSMDGFADSMSKLSGRDLLLESISNIFKSISSIVTPIKEAFSEIFEPLTSNKLYNAIETFRNFTAKLILNEEQADKLKRTFKGLFAVIDIVVTVVKTLASAMFKVLSSFSGLGNGILDVTASIGDFLLGIRDSIKESGSFAKVINNIASGLANFITSVKDKVGSIAIFNGLVKVLKTVWSVIKSIFSKIKEVIGGAFTSFTNGGGSIFDIINALLAGGFLVKLTKLVKGLDNVKEGLTSFIDVLKSPFKQISGIFEAVSSSLSTFQNKLKAETIKKLAVAIAILSASILVLSLIDKEKLVSSMTTIVASLGLLMGAMTLLKKIDAGTLKSVKYLVTISTSLLILSFALKKLGSMGWEEIARGLVAMGVALLELIGALTLLTLVSKIDGNTKSTKLLTKMSVALLVLSFALKNLATMSWSEIGRGLTAMAGSLLILVGTITLITLVSKIDGNSKATKQLTTMAVALVILTTSLKILATMSWSDIGRGLTAMSGALLVLVGTLTLLTLVSKIGGTKGGVVKLLALTSSLLVLTTSLKILATMSWSDIGRGLTAMSGALLVLVGTLTLLSLVSKISGSGSMIATASAVLIMSSAIIVLATGLALLGSLKVETIAKGLITLVVTLAAFVGVCVLLSSTAPAILALSASLLLFGAALTLIGAGIVLISTGLMTLVATITGSGALIVNTVVSIVKGIISLIPFLLESLAEGIVAFCTVLAESAPTIGKAFTAILITVIDSLVQIVPRLASGLMEIIVGVMEALAEYAPQIVQALFKLIVRIIESLVELVPELVVSVMKVLGKLFDGIVEALGKLDSESLLKAVLAVGMLAVLMTALSAVTALLPGAMAGILGIGVIIAELALVLAAIGALAQIPGLQWLVDSGGSLLESIGTAIGRFVGGIIGGIAQGMTSVLPSIGMDLSRFMINIAPFLQGLTLINSGTVESAKNLVSLMLTMTGASIVERLTSWLTGGQSMAKFGNELASFGEGMKTFANNVSGIDPTTVKAAAEAGKSLADIANSIPTSGGLWNVISGGQSMSTFGDEIASFGKGIKDFATETSGVNAATIQAAAEAGITLVNMTKSIPASGGLWDIISGGKDMAVFRSSIKNFGKAIKDFANEASGANISDAVNKVEELNRCLSSFTITGISAITESINSASEKVGQLASSMIQSAINAVTSKISLFASAGRMMMISFINAINVYVPKVKSIFSKMVMQAISYVNSENVYTQFYNSGMHIVQGLANGISENDYIVEAKAKAMAEAAVEAAKEALNEHSPSKKFYEIGEYAGKGLVLALEDYEGISYKAGSGMADQAVKGLSNTLSKVSDVLANDVDTQPTITPILDLSNISDGANSINKMLGITPSVGVLSKVNSISSDMNKNQNGSNYEVISAIKDLANKIESTSGGNTYNINGITYDDGSNIKDAVEAIARAALIEGRV